MRSLCQAERRKRCGERGNGFCGQQHRAGIIPKGSAKPSISGRSLVKSCVCRGLWGGSGAELGRVAWVLHDMLIRAILVGSFEHV